MPPNNPTLNSPGDAKASVTSDSHNHDEELRSSFIALVQNVLGAERTSSFSEKEEQLGFTVSPPILASELISAAQGTIGARFTVKHAIGRGGFGTVYLAHDESLDRDVAIKVPHEKLRNDPQLSSQCLKEARLAAKLRHPSIVTIFDINEEAGRIGYIVQEFVQGATLQELIGKQQLSIRQSIHIIVKVAEAIQFAHAKGVYHRDLKPANLIVDETGGIRVLDFGLAVDEEMQRSSRGQIAGTIAYMSPEQLEGRTHHLDGRTDIWSLGVIFYELLTGRRPFRGNQDEVAEQIIKREAAPPRQSLATIPKRVEACCLKCLEKSIPARFGTALDLLDELKAIIETEPLPEDSPSGPRPANVPQDTKKLGKDTTKELPKRTGAQTKAVWWIWGAAMTIGVVFAVYFSLVAAIWRSSLFLNDDGANSPQLNGADADSSANGSLNLITDRPDDIILHRQYSDHYFDRAKFTLTTSRSCAALFAHAISWSNYDVQMVVREVEWRGQIAVLLGARESSSHPGIWCVNVVQFHADDSSANVWKMRYGQLIIDSKSGVIKETDFLGPKIEIPTLPEESINVEVSIRNNQLEKVKFGRFTSIEIGAVSQQMLKLAQKHAADYSLPPSDLNGRVGILLQNSTASVSKAIAVQKR